LGLLLATVSYRSKVKREWRNEMSLVDRRVRLSNVILGLAVIASSTAVTLAWPLAVNAQAANSAHPACQASQITVTAGATVTNTTYTVKTSTGLHQVPAYEEVPVYFYNRGTPCHLLMGAPYFQAVRNTTDVVNLSALSAHDVSVGAGADNTRRPVVIRHQKLEALFVVVKPVGPSFKGCDPATASGIVTQGYASPIGTFHFVVRQLRDVCFDSGVGALVVNIGAVWVPTH
jgi:hypothetical protein